MRRVTIFLKEASVILPRSLDARYSCKFLAIIIINGAPLLAAIIGPKFL